MADSKTFDSSRADFAPYGFAVELWQPAKLPRADRHAEIEVNYMPKGTLTYVYGGKRLVLQSKQFTVFWAAIPHQIIEFDQADPYFVITIPLRQAIDWQLPRPLLNSLIHGQVLQDPPTFNDIEHRRFSTWYNDFESGHPIRQEAMALELRARLLRLFSSLSPQSFPSQVCKSERMRNASALGSLESTSDEKLGPNPSGPEIDNPTLTKCSGPVSDSHKKVESIVSYIAENYQRKLLIEEIASSVGLHVEYATALFRRSFGTTMVDLITCYRVTHSQRLLITTAKPISEVARESGFETLSRFNSAFKQFSGTTPTAYRREMGPYLTCDSHR